MPKLSLNIRPFNLKLKYPFGISRGSISCAKNVLLKLSFEDVVAYGEAAPSVYYGEDQSTVLEFLYAFTKHRIMEEYLTNIQKLRVDLDNFKGVFKHGLSSAARVSLEMAFWDLIGKINNKALYEFFFQDDPFFKTDENYMNLKPTSFTIGLDNITVIEEKIKKAVESGYKILKVKVGLGYEEDLNILRTVSGLLNEYEDKCVIRIDANGGWDIETTNRMLDLLPEFNVEILEQPMPKGQIHLLKSKIKNSPVQLFADEDCIVSDDIENLAGKVHGVNIKLMKVGSIIEAFNMINLAKSYNLKVMLGCMIESSCSISAAVHFSPLADYVDLDGHLLLESDPFSGLTLENNKLIPSFDVGLGVALSVI